MVWNHKEIFRESFEPVSVQCSNLAPKGANLTGLILDLRYGSASQRFFEFIFLNRSLPDAEILTGLIR